MGAREGEPRRVGPLLASSPPPHPRRLFSPCYLCSEKAQPSSWKRCLLPRTAWDLGLRLSLPGLGAQSVWAKLGTGRWPGSPRSSPLWVLWVSPPAWEKGSGWWQGAPWGGPAVAAPRSVGNGPLARSDQTAL